MAILDVFGVHAVCSLIEQSCLTKFCIYKDGVGKHTPPVFEFIKVGATNSQARDCFSKWAGNVMSGGNGNANTYDILLFNDIEVVNEGGEDERIVKTQSKRNKLRFSFALSSVRATDNHSSTDAQSIGELIKLSIASAMAERDKLDLLTKINALESRLNEQEDEDEPQEQSTQNRLLEGLGAIILSKLGGSSPPAPSVLNGVNDHPEGEVLANINKSISILWKHNKKLDADLLKLSALAENNKTQFDFLLNALRSL